MIRTILIAALVIAAGGFAWLYSQDFAPVVLSATRGIVANTSYQQDADADDFKILFCGTGSPNRTPHRGQPCLALVANGKLFLFDAGEGAIAKLHMYRAPTLKLSAIFLTHLHSDHMSGVAEVLHNTWLYGRDTAVETIGPPGTAQFIDGIVMSYDEDINERNRVLGHENIRPEIAFGPVREIAIEDDQTEIVYAERDLLIEAFHVNHPDWRYAYGYRITHQGKQVVISGDTTASEGIRRHARGADILIHEAVNMALMDAIGVAMDEYSGPIPGERFARIATVHTDTLELARLAQEVDAKRLIITHLIPAVPDNFVTESFFTSGMSEEYDGELTVARDGMWLSLAE